MTLAKNWIAAAAQELASHFSYGGEPDSYVTDEQRHNVAKHYEAIIALHCPMQPDVAYMSVPRCETCKHWMPDGTGKQGDCNLAAIASSDFSVYSNDLAGLETSADFGCVKWEVRHE